MESWDIKTKITEAKYGDKKALEEIITRYMPFVIKSAKSIYIRGYELSDLIQIGQVSIIKAVKLFDVNKSSGFTSYVTNAITKNFYTLIRSNVKKVSCCSLNAVNQEGYELIDSLPSEENLEEQYENKEEILLLRKALEKLSEKDRYIINWFYFKNKTLDQYAKEEGIGYRTAVDRKKRALENLKKLL